MYINKKIIIVKNNLIGHPFAFCQSQIKLEYNKLSEPHCLILASIRTLLQITRTHQSTDSHL